MWTPRNGRVIVELESLQQDSIMVGGVSITIDTAFRRQWHATQVAEVVAADERVDVLPGDTVYVHHHVIEEERRVPVKDKEYRWLENNQIYCRVRDGILHTLGYYVLVTPIKYDESKFKLKSDSGLILSQKAGTEYVDRVGVIAHLGPIAEAGGSEVGDTVLFNKNCEYEMEIEGKKYYRMAAEDIITVIDPEVEFTV